MCDLRAGKMHGYLPLIYTKTIPAVSIQNLRGHDNKLNIF